MAAVPVEQLLAMKQQLEELEKTFQEQLAQEQALTRKLKRKAKTQKATIAELRAQQPQQPTGSSDVVSRSGTAPLVLTRSPSEDMKGAGMEILELRQALEQSAKERSLVRMRTRTCMCSFVSMISRVQWVARVRKAQSAGRSGAVACRCAAAPATTAAATAFTSTAVAALVAYCAAAVARVEARRCSTREFVCGCFVVVFVALTCCEGD